MAPNEVHMGCLPRLPLTRFERPGVARNQSSARDHLVYCNLATDGQQRAYDIVLRTPRLHRCSRDSPQLRPLRRSASNPQIHRWRLGARAYNTAATIPQDANPDKDAKVLKAKILLNWAYSYKVLTVQPCPSAYTSDGSPLGGQAPVFVSFGPGFVSARPVPDSLS